MFKIGKITQTFGLRGELKVISFTDYDRFKKGEMFYCLIDQKEQAFEIEHARISKDRYIIKIKGINHINDVLFLVGQDMFAPKKNEVSDDSVHFNDLIGKEVVLDNGTKVGNVISILIVPQGHILEIESQGKKIMIPFVKAFIGPIDENRIVIYPIEGMLWKLIL